VSLDGGHGVVCRGEELERQEGDSNSPPTHRIVRTERTGYHDAHGYIPEADLSLPAGSDAPRRTVTDFGRNRELSKARHNYENGQNG
jgi:hypothetical protein